MECTLPDHSMKRRHSVISTPTRMMAALPGATTALESCDGSGGDEDLQLWTLVNLSKMTESSSMVRIADAGFEGGLAVRVERAARATSQALITPASSRCSC